MSVRDDYERTKCDCAKCVAGCKHIPGFLAPGDLETMLPADLDHSLGEPDEWLRENFMASFGAQAFIDGQLTTIPTITPKLGPAGCVFLQAGRCTVHEVAPFGCGWFDICNREGNDDEAKVTKAFRAILADRDANGSYIRAWKRLRDTDNRAPNIHVRRGNLQREIEEIERSQTTNEQPTDSTTP